ncbi:MAG TPA: arsenate reductase ArsC [Thermoanaerobaculia bacterium]|jgi:protein-tyrosine-phosphatase|nr:arsenate reductase ArsC [Thermoanaerobaculia bacterium]
MANEQRFRMLFVCTGNSARSIMAEYLLRDLAPRRFETFSAGSEPKGEVNPLALKVLEKVYRIDTAGARSKPLTTYQDNTFDFVITVCDRARESCPIWPGQPIVAHWGMEDPAAVEGTPEEKLRAFKRAAIEIRRLLELFINLPFEKLNGLRLQEATQEIGQTENPGRTPWAQQ